MKRRDPELETAIGRGRGGKLGGRVNGKKGNQTYRFKDLTGERSIHLTVYGLDNTQLQGILIFALHVLNLTHPPILQAKAFKSSKMQFKRFFFCACESSFSFITPSQMSGIFSLPICGISPVWLNSKPDEDFVCV